MKMLKCPICGRVKATNRRNHTCSRECGQKWLKLVKGADFHRLAGVKAGRASGEVTRRRMELQRQRRFPGVPADQAQAIYLRGYNSGHASGRRLGFQQGYEAALSGLRLGKTA